ncbi:glycosyl transferase [Geothrix rubra]|uniref:Glycosyl transferase n=1 Tax=Geothrix rubra TaxID=2927977 RepID=A0ABQ5Q336_9BACT|nr:ATP-grasp fold amidoligase family protein [Geothrix rubra]GLH68851.1 glycosyl transferase [Geothrix rubra]
MVMVQEQQAPGVLRRIKDSPAVERLYIAVFRVIDALLYQVSPALTARSRYRRMMGRRLPLDRPVTFDEKLIWLMLYWHHPLKTQCADKLGMRSYVEGLGYGHLLVDLLGVYERVSDIDFTRLPDRFVLKCTHGSGYNIFCLDKGKLDTDQALRRLHRWMGQNYARVHGEVQYEGIQPRILCESFLDSGSDRLPSDYKLHCFHGKVHFTTVCTGRDVRGGCAQYDHYDRDWQKQLAISKFGLHPERWHVQPESYATMIEAAEALSKPFPYVRMDFYCVGGKPYLGEMTFTPTGCIDTGYTDEVQAQLGGMIQLPERLER